MRRHCWFGGHQPRVAVEPETGMHEQRIVVAAVGGGGRRDERKIAPPMTAGSISAEARRRIRGLAFENRTRSRGAEHNERGGREHNQSTSAIAERQSPEVL